MKILGLLVPLFLVLSCAKTSAAIVLYTDRAAWRVAAGGGVGDLVDDFNTGTFTRTGFVLSGAGISAAFPNSNVQTSIDGSGYARFLLDAVGDDTGLFTFSSPMLAIGYDVNPQGPNAPQGYNDLVLVSIDGVQEGLYALPSSEVNGFVGFVSDTPFLTYEIASAVDFAWHGADNFEAFLVPEPSTYFAAGFLVLVAGYHLVRARRAQLQSK